MLKRAQAPGFSAPEHCIWPASQWNRIDPTRPARKWDTAWRRLRDIAGLPGLRFHGLRHTIIHGTGRAGMRRGVRVVEGARLESVCRGNLTEGSNPSLSARGRCFPLLAIV